MNVNSYSLAMTSQQRTPLELGMVDLSIGQYSVGLAPSRTNQQLVEAYLELISLVRRSQPEYLRENDFEILSAATGLDPSYFRNRVESHLRTLEAA